MGGYAWVTLATNDAYSLGALVLAHSLRRVGTKYELAVLITPGVTQTMREKLSAVFSVVTEVNVLDSKDEANLALLARPELGVTFTKLHCWRLTQYEKCVFLDADTLVVRNCDELFEREELSAAPDVGWPDCFNSGVFVYKPSQQTFASITAFAAAKGSFDGGDQGLLNMYFSDWARKDISKHLPFIYNMCSTATYSYLPAFKQFGDDVRIIHFIGITKPWLQYFDTLTGIVQPPMGSHHLQPLLQLWWNIFCEKVHPQLSPVMATSTLAPIWHEFPPLPYESPIPRSSPVFTDIKDRTQTDIHLEPPDFSEFQDPWENYCTQNDPILYGQTENTETQQYYLTNNSSCSEHYQSPREHSREFQFHHKQQQQQQQYSDHNNSPSYTQHVQYTQHTPSPRQSNQSTNETAVRQQQQQQHHSYFLPDDYFSITQHNHQHTPVYSVQNHHSNETHRQHQHVEPRHVTCNNVGDNRGLAEKAREHHQHVDYRSDHQRSPGDSSNKSWSEGTREQQHNEPYVEYRAHYGVYDHVNSKEGIINTEMHHHHHHHHRTEERLIHESIGLDNNKVDHRETMQISDIAYHGNDLSSVTQNTERYENVHATDERTNTLTSCISPHPDSTPCTDIHNVATQSDPHITDDLSCSNGGLAGALAQMTLGEPRSAEQIALEEHMRKQSWEQGHIDYMGRDSFDNIWKKICETLSLAPPRLPSPPKETEQPAKATTDKTDESLKSSELTEPIESIDEVDKGTAQATTTSQTEEQSLVNNVPITSVPKLSEKSEPAIDDAACPVKKSEDQITEKISIESKSETPDAPAVDSSPANLPLQPSKESREEFQLTSSDKLLKEAPTTVPIESPMLVQSASVEEQKVIASPKERETAKSDIKSVVAVEELKISVDVEETKQSEIDGEKHAKELSTASEILTVSPVPIQVAESVLQVEPKESMSDSQVMPQEVVSCTITPVHLTEAEDKLRINGSAAPPSDSTPQKEEDLSSDKVASVEKTDTVSKLSEVPKSVQEVSQAPQILSPVEQIQSQPVETSALSTEKMVESAQQKTTTEPVEQRKESESCTKDTAESTLSATSSTTTAAESEKSKTTSTVKTPVRPTRAKELSTSSASVPKSSTQASPKSQEKTAKEKKTVKKSLEKSASEGETAEATADTTDGADGPEKKAAKKVVKKVVKKTKTKPEEGADDGAEDSSASKQKKTVKVVKKGTKSSQTGVSGSDSSAAPETASSTPSHPSSGTSDVPVPPKRKTKSTTAKTVTKSKPDAEQ